MKKQDLKQSLEEKSIRPTPVRMAVIELLERCSHALSHADIESEFGALFNRVTLYRTLHTLEEKAIIHKVVDDDGVSKFMLSDAGSHHDEAEHEHLHFKCNRCGHLFCLDTTENIHIDLPTGFKLDHIVVNAEGLCDECSH